MSFSESDAALIVGLVAFAGWQAVAPMSSSAWRYYQQHLKRMPWHRLPPATFGVVWTLLLAMNVAAVFTFVKLAIDVAYWTVPAVVALDLAMGLLNRAWTYVFFDLRTARNTRERDRTLTTVALVIAILLLLASGTATGLMFASGSNYNAELYLLPALLTLPYPLWCVVAIYLNATWLQYT
jgi:tryptophan-rich sensory protein